MTIDPKIDYAGMVAQVFATRDDILSEQAAGMLAQQWQLRSLADAYTERPPREFLVDGLLPMPSLSIVYGARITGAAGRQHGLDGRRVAGAYPHV